MYRMLMLMPLVCSIWWIAPATGAHAQEADASAADASNDEFATMFTEWKEMLTRMREIQMEYNVAEPGDRQALEDEFNQLRARGVELTPKLEEAAKAAYLAAPSDESEAGHFVLSMLVDNIRRDNFEEAHGLARFLIDNGFENKVVHNFGGVAAFYINEVDEAEELFKAADEAGKLDSRGKDLRSRLESHRAKWEKEQAIRGQEAVAEGEAALPRVLLETTKGNILLELFENEAPNTVANFISLVEKPFYDGVTFHRVLPGFMAQGGDPDGTGLGGPGYRIRCECYEENHRLHFRGSLSMAKSEARDTGGSQFFLTFVPTDHLDGLHTVFGRVVEGIEVLAELQRRNPEGTNAPEPDKIVRATVVRKRSHEYVPETLPE